MEAGVEEDEEFVINYAHVYLCGHLNTDKNAAEVLEGDWNWKKEEMEQKDYQTVCNIYYESFVDSLVSVKGRDKKSPYGNTAHLIREMNRPCRLCHRRFHDWKWEFTVDRLHLFFFPYGICLFAIEVSYPSGCDLNDLTFAHSLLREVCSYEEQVSDSPSFAYMARWKTVLDAPEYLETLRPLLVLCGKSESNQYKSRYSELVYTGNKLKIFQILTGNRLTDSLLYELGTMSPIGCVDNHANYFSPSQDYYDAIMKAYSISVFRNWKALALFDSFTVLRIGGGSEDMRLWRDSYFRLIYMHALYQKTLLFIVNKKFRSDTVFGKYDRLLHDMKDQEHWYAFSNISYNFLPQLIYKSIDTGLEIASERNMLHQYLLQEAERQELTRGNRLGKLILFLTLLTVLSALNDGTSLIRELLDYEAGSSCHWLIFYILLGIVMAGFAVWGYFYYFKRKR